MTNQQKKRAEELASEYAPVTWVKGIDISTSSRFGFVAGYLAAVEEYEGLLEECEMHLKNITSFVGGCYGLKIEAEIALQKLRARKGSE